MTSPVPYFYSKFKSIQTNNFDIHYPSLSSEKKFNGQNMKKIAEKTAVFLEEAFAYLTKELHSTPYLRTQVVLTDATDLHNGFASPIPQNIMYLYLVPPYLFSTTSEYDNWLRETIIHELTHIINLSSSRGYSNFLRNIFGTVVSINGLWPLSNIEGLAVYEETIFSKRGRGRSTLYHTMLRTSVYENTLYDIYKLSLSPYVTEKWPWGMVPYQYGYFLFEHVAQQYGKDIPGKISIHNSGVIPYYPSYSFNKYTGKNIDELWGELLIEKNNFYSNWVTYLKKQNITKVLSSYGEQNINRTSAISPNGKKIAYYSFGTKKKSEIVVEDIDDKKILLTFKPYNFLVEPLSIKWIDNEKIIFNTLKYKVDSMYYQVAVYNIITKKLNYINNSERTIYLHPLNEYFLCTVKAETGINTLNLETIVNSKIIETQQVYKTNLLSRLSKPFCYVDKKGEIVFYVIEKEIEKNEQIIRFNSINSNKEVVYSSSNNILDFVVKNDKIVFIEDHNGVFNLYEQSLKDKKIKRLTNMLSGAFELVQVAEEQNFYVTYYTSNGYKIGKISTDDFSQYKENFEVKNVPINNLPVPAIPSMSHKNYYPYKTLLPKFWLPWFEYVNQQNRLGVFTYGSDALFRHQYYVSGLYNLDSKKTLFEFEYLNQSFYPTFSFFAGINDWNLNKVTPKAWFPISYFWSLYSGYKYQVNQNRGFYFGLSFNETSTSIAAISNREKGVSGFLEANKDEFKTSISLFIPMLWKHHVLAVNNNFAYNYGKSTNWYISGGETSLKSFSKDDFLLRGFPGNYIASKAINIINTEYRFPLFRFNNANGLFPLFIRNMHAAIISDNAFLGKSFTMNLNSLGIELRSDSDLFYHVPATLRLGYYRALQIDNNQIYIGVSLLF